jgi:hypothetical protein
MCAHLLAPTISAREARHLFLSIHHIITSAPPRCAPTQPRHRGAFHRARPAVVLSLHHTPAPPPAILPLHGHRPAAAFPVGRLLHRSCAPLRSIELCVDGPSFVQIASRCCAESACCKRMLSVPCVLEVCCKCFHTDVTKVDLDVPYVLQWLYSYVVSVCCKYFICFFRCMLQMFYLDLAYVCNDFKAFSGVLQEFRTYVASV